MEGGEEVPEFHAVEAVEELTSLKKVEMECYLGVCHILLVHSQPKPLYGRNLAHVPFSGRYETAGADWAMNAP